MVFCKMESCYFFLGVTFWCLNRMMSPSSTTYLHSTGSESRPSSRKQDKNGLLFQLISNFAGTANACKAQGCEFTPAYRGTENHLRMHCFFRAESNKVGGFHHFRSHKARYTSRSDRTQARSRSLPPFPFIFSRPPAQHTCNI